MLTVAQALGITVGYLGSILCGRRRLSVPVRRKAASLFKVQQQTLDQVLNIRDVQRLMLHQARSRKVA
jgi:hypothetical protein